VRQINPRDPQFSRDFDRHLLLEIPINLTERTIIAQVRKMIRQHPERVVERVSTARRKLAKLIGLRQDVIESAHAVWRLHYESRDGRPTEKIGQTTGTKSLYQIGKELRLVKTCMPAVTDDAKRAAMRVNGMKVAVSRMLSRANNLIDNAAVGIFPSVQIQPTPIVWRPRQQQQLAEAVAAKLWRPLFGADDVLTVPLPDDRSKNPPGVQA